MSRARWAMLIPDADGDLLPSGEGTASYTQAGPVPGVCEPRDASGRLRVAVSGAQESDLGLQAIRPGNPSYTTGLALAYDVAGDDDWRGWSPPNLVTEWTTSGSWGGSTAFSFADSAVATNPVTGAMVTVAGTAAATTLTRRYDPRAGTWALGAVWVGTDILPAELAYDPDNPGRLLLWANDTVSYYSDDDGTTWTLYAVGGWSHAVSGGMFVAPSTGPLWLAVADSGGNPYLWTSTTRGTSWTRAEALASLGSKWRPLRTRFGWVVIYTNATDDLCARVMSYTSPNVTGAEEVIISSAANYTRIGAAVDSDGRIWVVAGSGTPARSHGVWVSTDGGATWAALGSALLGGGSGDSGLGAFRLVASGGSLYLWTATATAGGTDPTTDEMHVLRLGGWGTVESGPGLATDTPTNRMGWGGGPTGTESLGLWVPVDVPEDSLYGTWTLVGSGGTWAFGGDEGGNLSGSVEHRYRATASAARGTLVGLCQWRMDDATTVNLGTIGAPASRATVAIELSNGTYRYRVVIRLGADGLRVEDPQAGTSLAAVSLDGKVRTYVRWHATKGAVWVWYRQGAGTAWNLLADGAALANAGASATTTDRVVWGNDAAGTANTRTYWELFAAMSGGGWHHGIDAAGEVTDTPADRPLGLRFGKAAAPGSYPIPDAAPAGGPLTWVSVQASPAYAGETVDVPVRYTLGVANLDSRSTPSPRVGWESTDGSVVQTLEFDDGTTHYRGGALGLVLCDVRISSAVLEYHDGAGWVTLGTGYAGSSGTYTRNGRSIRPTATTPLGASDSLNRYLRPGELTGGWVRLEDAGDYYYAPIVTNSGGWWSTTADQQATITIDPTDAVAAGYTGSSGNVAIYPPNMVILEDLDALAITIRRLRIVLTAFNVQNPPTHRLGVASFCRVVGVSTPPSWGWRQTLELTRRLTRSEDGVPSVTETGPPRVVWSGSWSDGVPMRLLRGVSNGVVLGAGTGIVGSEHDQWGLWGEIERGLLSGAVPLAIVTQPSIGRLTDPTRWVWGRLTADNFAAVHVAGTEGSDEVVRVDGPTVESIR